MTLQLRLAAQVVTAVAHFPEENVGDRAIAHSSSLAV
jgi:hypothetical protein